MSTPATNWSYTSIPQPVLKGKAVAALTIGQATVGSLTQCGAPKISVPGNLHYFKAYGGDSTDGGNVAAFLVADPDSSSAFSLTTRKFTAPVNGLYRFATVCYSACDSATHASIQRIRGTETINLQYLAIKDSYESQGASIEVFLMAGDNVQLYCDSGRLRLADYNAESFTLSSLTYAPRTTFEGRLVYETA